jgi:Ni/Co efflux regulator RcnB
MRALTLVALAASAAGFAPAMAQTVPDQDYGVAPDRAPPPPARMRQAPPPGTTWHSNGAPMQMQQQMQMRGQMMPPPQMGYGQQGQRQNFVLHRTGPGPAMGRRHVDYRHIQRGGFVPNRWWGPNVQVRNWQMYGFPQPFAGGRWIRYYDDALLIDGSGRVYDSRPGWDWDRYGDRWSYGDDGVPFYGDEDDDDYRSERREYVERYDHRDMGPGPQVRERVYMQQAPMPMGPPPCANVCGGGYGYGYGAGPVLVTETTITEAPVVEQRTIVTYETVRVPVRHRRHVVRCGCRRAAPPPPVYGERG